MALIPRSTLSTLSGPAVRAWDRVPIRVQGRITVALPLLAVLVSASFAFLGNQDRVAIETDIQRKFEMTGSLGEVTTLMVNAETGMRGYLLTGRPEFLEPFDEASKAMPGAITRLNDLAAAEPGEKPRVDKLARVEQIRGLTDQQLADLARQRGYMSSGRLTVSNDELLGHLSYGKNLMDQIRGQVEAMEAEESALLDDRIADINAIRVRDYILVAVALVVAVMTRFIAWYLFRNGTLRRVERLTEVVRSRRERTPAPDRLPPKGDKMGELEREVDLLAADIAPPATTPDAASALPAVCTCDDGPGAAPVPGTVAGADGGCRRDPLPARPGTVIATRNPSTGSQRPTATSSASGPGSHPVAPPPARQARAPAT